MKQEVAVGLFKDLPTWAKGTIAIVVVGGVAFLGYKLYKGISGAVNISEPERALLDVNNDIKKLSKTQKPSYNGSQYRVFADSLYEAMSGMGTDEEEVFNVFRQMKNTLDVLLLTKAFDIRAYNDDRVFLFNSDIPMNLNQWISRELSSSDKAELNKILSSKGIKYIF
jgi:hypothetical protein